MIPLPSERGKKIEMYSRAFCAACTASDVLSCGLTHMAATPLVNVKCNMQQVPIAITRYLKSIDIFTQMLSPLMLWKSLLTAPKFRYAVKSFFDLKVVTKYLGLTSKISVVQCTCVCFVEFVC